MGCLKVLESFSHKRVIDVVLQLLDKFKLMMTLEMLQLQCRRYYRHQNHDIINDGVAKRLAATIHHRRQQYSNDDILHRRKVRRVVPHHSLLVMIAAYI